MIQSMKIKYILYCLLLIKLISNPGFAIVNTDTQVEIDSLVKLYTKLKDTDEKKHLLKTLSSRYEDTGSWEKYEEIVQEMLRINKEQPDSFYLAETYNKLGISNCILGKNKEALDYFYKTLEINLALKDEVLAANSYENLGIVYKDMGNYTQAVDCQLKSLEIRKAINNERMFNNYIKLSIIQELLGDREKMDFYLEMAKDEMNKRDSVTPRNKALFYNQLGDIYNKSGLNDSSIACYRKVISNSEQIGWKLGIATGIGNIAEIFYEEELIDSAIFYHKKSLKLSQDISNNISTTEEYLALAKLYDEIGKYDSVMYFANNALQMAKKGDLLLEQSITLKFIANFYSAQKNYLQANNYLKQHYIIKDSISSTEVKNNVADLETRYETKMKEQQIELLTSENQLKNQRMWLFVAATIILILTILIGVFIFIRNKKENLQRQEDLKQQLLRSQMNPHFLFNALGSIQNFMLKNETKRAARYLNNFASLTRNILEQSSREFVSVTDEIETLRSYMELEKMRMEDHFEFEISYDKNLETDFINIPPMLIQPFIENAIKHGLNNINYKGLLELKFEDRGTVLHIEIADNGVGIKNAELNKSKKHRSMSMNIFEQRRIVLAKRTKHAIGLEVVDRNNLNKSQTGTLVKIEIPIVV